MLIPCYECGNPVSTDAKACVRCGAPPRVLPAPSASEPKTELERPPEQLVSYENAIYEVICPTCGNTFGIKGKSLATKEQIKCPHPHGAQQDQKVKTGTVKYLRLTEGRVVYRRIRDFFSYSGRLSVADYWLSILIVLPFLLLLALLRYSPIYPIAFFGLLHPLWIKRYHDLGMQSGWIAIQGVAATISAIGSLLAPKMVVGGDAWLIFRFLDALTTIAALIVGVALAFKPGVKKSNRYGPPKGQVKRLWW